MIQQEKQLLLQDLCSRLPYGVKVNYERPDDGQHYIDTLEGIDEVYFCEEKNSNVVASVGGIGVYIDVCKPYLRPMSSMTEEERKEYLHITLCDVIDCEAWNEVDWLNAHHFDYRGLIDKGIALQAPEGMYK